MMDDSLPDAVTQMHAPAFDRMSNESMIAELKRRGYKVYPEKRVRIYGVKKLIPASDLLVTPPVSPGVGRHHRSIRQYADPLEEYTLRGMAMSMGKQLLGEQAMPWSKRNYKIGDGVIYDAQVCVVLPNDLDFESEMWGIRR